MINVNAPRNHHEGRIPCRAVPPRITPVAGRNDTRKITVGTLFVNQVVDPFFIAARIRKVILRQFARKISVACPSVLFTMRTVGRIPRDEVVAIRFERRFLKLIKEFVIRFKRTGLVKRRIDEASDKIARLRRGTQTKNFDILIAVVSKTGFEIFFFFSVAEIEVGLEFALHARKISGGSFHEVHRDIMTFDFARIDDAFRVTETDDVPLLLSGNAHARPTRAVASHIDDIETRLDFFNAFRFVNVGDDGERVLLRRDLRFPARSVDDLSLT